MKTSLDELPPKKQQQLRAVTELIQKEVDAEMIILFGSHARGDWVEDPVGRYFSDFDLLVIVEKPSTVDRHQLWSKIEARASRLTQPTTLSLIVHDIRDINEQLEKGFYFVSDVKREGITLYDSQRFNLSEAQEKSPEERLAFAERCFEEWMGSADAFEVAFQALFDRGWSKSAAFQLHQVVERLYNTVLMVFTAYKPKTHNIEELGKRCGNLHPALRDVFPRQTPEEQRLFKLLKHAYVDARYNMSYAITQEELETMAAWVRDLRQKVEEVCTERVAELRSAAAG